MKQTIPYGTFLSCWIALLFLIPTAKGQRIDYRTALDISDTVSHYSFFGKTNDKIWILKTTPANYPGIIMLDSNGKEQHRITLSAEGLNTSFKPIAIFSSDTVAVFYQYRSGKYAYQNLLLLDQEGKKLGDIIRLDSARTDILKESALMQFLPLPKENKFLLYRLIAGRDPGKLIVDYATYFTNGQLYEKASHSIPFDRTVQDITAPYIHSNGKAYFCIYNLPEDYKLYSTISFYQLNTTESNSKIRDISYKGNKPIRPIFAGTTADSNMLGISSMYFTQGSVIANGILATEIDLSNPRYSYSTRHFPLQENKKENVRAGKFKLPVSYRPSRNDKLVLYAAFRKANGEWDFLMENGYSIFNNSSSSANNNTTVSEPVAVNNLTPSQNLDLIRDQAIQNINYSSNNNSGTYRFGNQGNGVIAQYGSPTNYYVNNNDYRYNYDRINDDAPSVPTDRLYSNEYRESQKLIHYFITAHTEEGIRKHQKWQSTIISKQLPMLSYKIINDSTVLIADVGNNCDRIDLKSFQTNKHHWRKELRLEKGKSILWRESILLWQQQLFFLYKDETNGRIGLASIKSSG